MGKIKIDKKSRVIVGMSGGVDSSVAAALLKNQGYEVIGIFLKFWHEPKKKGIGICENKCCSAESQSDARQVANILKIPFYAIDVSKEFKKRVVDYFVEGYKKGNTPNPCVECNKWIKFGLFLEKAKKMGADYLATGHYAQLGKEFPIKLLTAKDNAKDQSYFLWKLDQKQLAKILFPIGEYNKPQVRELARKFKLPVFEKRDSQEVCFINTNLHDFLYGQIRTCPVASRAVRGFATGANGRMIQEGDIVNIYGKKIGKHTGLISYTIGQRKGLNIGGTGPYYVVGKDIKKNILIVSNSEKDLEKKEMIVNKIRWTSGEVPKFPLSCQVKIRYLSEFLECKVLKVDGNKLKIIFKNSVRAITPGQSAVFYLKDELLGGGIIV